jgi:VCBS repeat-containing protein
MIGYQDETIFLRIKLGKVLKNLDGSHGTCTVKLQGKKHFSMSNKGEKLQNISTL